MDILIRLPTETIGVSATDLNLGTSDEVQFVVPVLDRLRAHFIRKVLVEVLVDREQLFGGLVSVSDDSDSDVLVEQSLPEEVASDNGGRPKLSGFEDHCLEVNVNRLDDLDLGLV